MRDVEFWGEMGKRRKVRVLERESREKEAGDKRA